MMRRTFILRTLHSDEYEDGDNNDEFVASRTSAEIAEGAAMAVGQAVAEGIETKVRDLEDRGRKEGKHDYAAFLWKCAKGKQSWKYRFAVLQGTTIRYFHRRHCL